MTIDKQRSQIFCADVEPPETDIILPLTLDRSKWMFYFLKELPGGCDEVKIQVDHEPQKCRQMKIMASILCKF